MVHQQSVVRVPPLEVHWAVDSYHIFCAREEQPPVDSLVVTKGNSAVAGAVSFGLNSWCIVSFYIGSGAQSCVIKRG